jgi:hypothetical protein
MSEVKTINFNDKVYKIEDLTDRAKEGFNFLFKLQEDIQNQSYELQKTQAAQTEMLTKVKKILEEDKILEAKPEPEPEPAPEPEPEDA